VPFSEFTDKFGAAVAEIEAVEYIGKEYEGIVVGRINEIREHPDSDKLLVSKVDIGNKIVQVCAGAKNLKEDDLVAYIKPGNRTPVNPYPNKSHIEIKKTKLGGVVSNGMLLSEKELGIGEDHSRILVLDEDAKPGTPIAEVYDLKDTILEVENKAFTHRPDCFGLIGLAREMSAAFDLDLNLPDWYYNAEIKVPESSEDSLDISVENPSENEIYIQRYTAIKLSNVEVKESPVWLKVFLKKHNVQSVNNVVDITNYVMLLTSQPLHAFDSDKLSGGITVRMAKKGEKMRALNDKVYTLDENMVVIADEKGPVGIGGIIGGQSAEISPHTQEIILESANFDKYNIRRTSMKLGLFTDAVTRFGKGQDPEQTKMAASLTVDLLEQEAGAQVSAKVYDNYPHKRKEKKFGFSTDYIYKRSGISEEELPKKEMVKILDRLDLSPVLNGDQIQVTVPTFRYDIDAKEDILEEVARLYGYNKMKPSLPTRKTKPVRRTWNRTLRDKLRESLREVGGSEMLNYSFVGEELYDKCNLDIADNAYKLYNPLSPRRAYMRTSMLPSMLEKLKLNINLHKEIDKVFLFEFGKTHIKGKMDSEEDLPKEYEKLCFGYTEREIKENEVAYYQVKLLLEKALEGVGLLAHQLEYVLLDEVEEEDMPQWVQLLQEAYHPKKSALIIVEDNVTNEKIVVGILGDLHPKVIKEMGLPMFTGVVEMKYDNLPNRLLKRSNYKEPYSYPSVMQDLCFVVDEELKYADLYDAIRTSRVKENIEDIQPVDIFQQEDQEGKKQITVRVYLNSYKEQLSEKQVEEIREDIIKAVEFKTEGSLKAL
jgi:phenylalanyl-tRNA synthetase beta chain